MAVLTDEQRATIWSRYMSDLSSEREQIATITKADLRDAVDAADQWVSDNAASYNTALPDAARTNLTADQKSRLLTFVVTKRFQEGA